MSLTKFLDLPHVKKRFSEKFALPRSRLSGIIKAPPLTNHYGLVGTAFDYSLRFYLQRLNPNSIASKWVAEDAVILLKSYDKRLYTKGSRYYFFRVVCGCSNQNFLCCLMKVTAFSRSSGDSLRRSRNLSSLRF